MRGPQDFENPLCAQVDPELFFPEGGHNLGKQIKAICGSCDHQIECAEWGLKHERHGVWGGLSEFERRQIRRRRNIIVETIPVEVYLAKVVPSVGNRNNKSDTAS